MNIVYLDSTGHKFMLKDKSGHNVQVKLLKFNAICPAKYFVMYGNFAYVVAQHNCRTVKTFDYEII